MSEIHDRIKLLQDAFRMASVARTQFSEASKENAGNRTLESLARSAANAEYQLASECDAHLSAVLDHLSAIEAAANKLADVREADYIGADRTELQARIALVKLAAGREYL